MKVLSKTFLNSYQIKVLKLSLLAMTPLLLTGCAGVMLAGAGYVIDADNGNSPQDISRASIKGFDPGTEIIIVEKDSVQSSGRYIGFAPGQASPDSVLALLPVFGDDIIVADTLGAKTNYHFWGFHYRYADKNWLPRIKVVSSTDKATNDINISSIRDIITKGNSANRAQMMQYIGGGGMPVGCAILLQDSSNVHQIPFSNIDSIKISPDGSAVFNFLIIGIFAVATFYALMFYAFASSPAPLD